MPSLPVYRGRFGTAEAERLLWRAGFGPRTGDAKRLAAKGVHTAVLSLTRPASQALVGPAPVDDHRFPIAPYDASGHDHLWWLDRMVRSKAPLVERMTLVWHDWFATSNQGVGSQKLMLDQNQLFRKNALGSFAELLHGVTVDPAMLVWLSGNKNTRFSPNENYGRELMELFTLGADRGYTELDVREQARALTGWRSSRQPGVGPTNFRYDPKFHDDGSKTIFGQSGDFGWEDSGRLCLQNSDHPAFFVRKLWGYFVPTAPPAGTLAGLEAIYRKGYAIRPVVEAILQHPAFYRGPRMVKPPAVYAAGLLRALGRGIDTVQWARLGAASGQRLFYPPNVGGWDESRWLDTATFRGRWFLAAIPLAETPPASSPATAEKLLSRATAFWGKPALSKATLSVLLRFARHGLALGRTPAELESALRQLVATSPDLQTA